MTTGSRKRQRLVRAHEPAAEPDGASSSTVRPPPARERPSSAASFRVTELTVRVRDLLETEFFEVWVEGELSNCRVWNTGHLYFTLKDAASQIRGVMFRSALRYLKFKPADGLRVVARGTHLGLRAEGRIPAGLRAPRAARPRRAAARLRSAQEAAAGAKGCSTPARKRPLPVAAAQDRHRHVARRRRDPRHHQGASPAVRERAPRHPARARAGRGRRHRHRARRCAPSGACRASTSSSSAAAAVRSRISGRSTRRSSRARSRVSPVPVISAVGHETDVTIADFVADLRAPTPSAAAEIVVAAKDEFCGRIDRLHDRLRAAARAPDPGVEPPRARRQRPPGASRASPAASRCAAATPPS